MIVGRIKESKKEMKDRNKVARKFKILPFTSITQIMKLIKLAQSLKMMKKKFIKKRLRVVRSEDINTSKNGNFC